MMCFGWTGRCVFSWYRLIDVVHDFLILMHFHRLRGFELEWDRGSFMLAVHP
jgi:hypothetical protein